MERTGDSVSHPDGRRIWSSSKDSAMVTETLPWIRSLAGSLTGDATTIAHRFGRLAAERLCAVHGHDFVLGFEPRRYFLRCAACGHETPGWTLDRPHYSTMRSRPYLTTRLEPGIEPTRAFLDPGCSCASASSAPACGRDTTEEQRRKRRSGGRRPDRS